MGNWFCALIKVHRISNKEVKIDFDNIHTAEFKLLAGQVDLLLKALELYAYNLDYMLDCENSEDEEKQKKIAMVKYTYEEILSIKAEQINGKVNEYNDGQITLGRKIIQNDNILKIIPDEREIQVG